MSSAALTAKQGRFAAAISHQSPCPGKGSSSLAYPDTLHWMLPGLSLTLALNSALPCLDGARAPPLPGSVRQREDKTQAKP